MTSSSPTQDQQKDTKPTASLSLTQVIAGALATVSAATLCSRLGVTGTLVGAAVMSITATTATYVYQHSMRHAARLARRAGTGKPSPPPVPLGSYSPPRRHRTRQHRLQRKVGIVSGLALMFGLAIGIITVIELAGGESLAGFWGQGGTAPSIVGGGSEPPSHAPSSTPSSSPSASSSANPSGTATTGPSAPVSPAPATTASTTSATTSSPTTSSSTSPGPTPSPSTTAPSRNFLIPAPSPSAAPAVPSANPTPTEAPTRVSGEPHAQKDSPPTAPESVIRAFGDARPTEGLVTRTP